ncbi:MAG: hypothetical protein ABSF69_08170 [Polyangiaceae bacterium]|jgi:hypothetical protein
MSVRIAFPTALDCDDDRLLPADTRFVRLRSQAAVVRALADHVEHLSRVADADAVGQQLVEEMARLGCRLLEASAALIEAPRTEESGVFARCPSSTR